MREGCGVKHVGCWPVNGRHLPSAFGEPDGIGAFSCADVESEARRQVGDLSNQVSIGFPTPHSPSRSVMLVPKGFVHDGRL